MILSENSTFYDILDISPDASPQDIREAYILAKTTYNRDSVALYTLIDTTEREEALEKIEKAYLVLSNPEKRRDYDKNHDFLNNEENPFYNSQLDFSAKIISIDRVPPMESSPEGDQALIPPSTDFVSSPNFVPNHSSKPDKSLKKAEINEIQDSEGPLSQPDFPTSSNFPLVRIDSELILAIQKETEWRGGFLKKVRDAYKISIEEMAGITKVTKTYLVALEEENFPKLPAAVFVRGFIIQIAKVLKLPHDRVAIAYLARYIQSQRML